MKKAVAHLVPFMEKEREEACANGLAEESENVSSKKIVVIQWGSEIWTRPNFERL